MCNDNHAVVHWNEKAVTALQPLAALEAIGSIASWRPTATKSSIKQYSNSLYISMHSNIRIQIEWYYITLKKRFYIQIIIWAIK